METPVCHAHNLIRPLPNERPYGIRVSLPPGDTFNALLAGWERFHWYATEIERDAALKDMASEHLYSRRGDRPTLNFDLVEKNAES